MRALIYDPDAPRGLRNAEVPEPEPGPGQALIEVSHAALNFGELAYIARDFRPGDVVGHDSAGVVLAAAADGSGPPAGARVAAFAPAGAWAQRQAVATADVAVVPEKVGLDQAAALPAAGVTALQAVRDLGSVLGDRVLVTGASGGAGPFAVQLAALAGAHVVAAVGDLGRAEGLVELGATEIVTTLDGLAPLDGVLDNVGGTMLADAFALLAEGGRALSIGMASGEATTIDFEAERKRGGRRRVEVFTVGATGGGFGADTARLLGLLEAGRLDPQIGWQGSWDDVDDAVAMLFDRRLRGKAVLQVTTGRAGPLRPRGTP